MLGQRNGLEDVQRSLAVRLARFLTPRSHWTLWLVESFRTLHNVQSFRRVRTLDGLGTLAGRSFFARVLRGLRGFQRQGTDVRDESAPFAAAGALRACSAFQATAEYGTATSRPQPQ